MTNKPENPGVMQGVLYANSVHAPSHQTNVTLQVITWHEQAWPDQAPHSMTASFYKAAQKEEPMLPVSHVGTAVSGLCLLDKGYLQGLSPAR